MTIQTCPIKTDKKPTSKQQSTSTLQKGETPTTFLQRACTLVHNLINIKHSSNTIDRNMTRKTERSMWRPANRGLAKVGL